MPVFKKKNDFDLQGAKSKYHKIWSQSRFSDFTYFGTFKNLLSKLPEGFEVKWHFHANMDFWIAIAYNTLPRFPKYVRAIFSKSTFH